jgi:hypothetical protein
MSKTGQRVLDAALQLELSERAELAAGYSRAWMGNRTRTWKRRACGSR